MACAHTFLIKNKRFGSRVVPNIFTKDLYYEVPCGYCMNCRVDKRNWLEDACNAEYKKYGYGAFVAFTYDNSTLNWSYDSASNDVVPTLRYSDFQKFLKRLRRNLDYYNLWNNSTCRRDFKYLCVGEYGDKFDRPHY